MFFYNYTFITCTPDVVENIWNISVRPAIFSIQHKLTIHCFVYNTISLEEYTQLIKLYKENPFLSFEDIWYLRKCKIVLIAYGYDWTMDHWINIINWYLENKEVYTFKDAIDFHITLWKNPNLDFKYLLKVKALKDKYQAIWLWQFVEAFQYFTQHGETALQMKDFYNLCIIQNRYPYWTIDQLLDLEINLKNQLGIKKIVK